MAYEVTISALALLLSKDETPLLCAAGFRQIYVLVYSTVPVFFRCSIQRVSIIIGIVGCNISINIDLKQVIVPCLNIICLGSACTAQYYPVGLILQTRNKCT
jgi:hypothetical protein